MKHSVSFTHHLKDSANLSYISCMASEDASHSMQLRTDNQLIQQSLLVHRKALRGVDL